MCYDIIYMLYIVATPIGNMADITFRAIDILKSVDMVLCEDTRQTKKLLDHYNISKPLVSYHQHSKIGKVDFIIGELKSGKNLALVSDAGTPGISDPGNMLVEAALKTGCSWPHWHFTSMNLEVPFAMTLSIISPPLTSARKAALQSLQAAQLPRPS